MGKSYRMTRIEASRGELLNQPVALKKTLSHLDKEIKEFVLPQKPEKIILLGCGDSYYSSLAMKNAMFMITGIPTEALQAFEFTFFPSQEINDKTLLIGISSSGETEAVLEALKGGKSKGAYSLALTNSPGSSVDKLADYVFHIQATRVGWPTQSSTSAMAALVRLAFSFNSFFRESGKDNSQLEQEFLRIPDLMEDVIRSHDLPMRKLAESLVKNKVYFFTGAGPNWGTANFGAAKVKEWSQDYALALHLEEFHHFMTLRAGDPIFVMYSHGNTIPRVIDTLKSTAKWGGKAILVTDTQMDAPDLAWKVITIPSVREVFAPFLMALPLQLFGLHLVHVKLEKSWTRPLDGDEEID